MEIVLTKEEHTTVLLCKRTDGTFSRAALGPSFPHHDLAHYVVETQMGFRKGFFGYIQAGKTIQELSERDIIRTLSPESMLVEVLVRNLQSLGSNPTDIDQFIQIVNWELAAMPEMPSFELSLEHVQQMRKLLGELCEAWEALPPQGQLSLSF